MELQTISSFDRHLAAHLLMLPVLKTNKSFCYEIQKTTRKLSSGSSRKNA
jgi:hypothetical protein